MAKNFTHNRKGEDLELGQVRFCLKSKFTEIIAQSIIVTKEVFGMFRLKLTTKLKKVNSPTGPIFRGEKPTSLKNFRVFNSSTAVEISKYL